MMAIELEVEVNDLPTSDSQQHGSLTSKAEDVVPLTAKHGPGETPPPHQRCLRSGCRIFLIFFLSYMLLIALFALLLLAPGEGCIELSGHSTVSFAHSMWLSHHSFSTIGVSPILNLNGTERELVQSRLASADFCRSPLPSSTAMSYRRATARSSL
jgi:hypothetical protein